MVYWRSAHFSLLILISGSCVCQFFNFPRATLVKKIAQAKDATTQSQQAQEEIGREQASRADKLAGGRTVSRLAGQAVQPGQNRPPPGKQEPAFVPQGKAQVFTPDQNPIKEKLEVQHLKTEEDFELNARLPPSQDFLPSCPDATFSYIIPSPSQCDLYYLCEFGTPYKKVCEDGLVFSLDEVKCVASHKATCLDRPLLQAPKGTGACQRKNGIFYTNATCNEFVTCRDNVPSFERCATGLVFDPEQQICAWADEALRPGCLPEDLLGFRCPNPKLTQEQALLSRVHLRFGDHDRFPDNEDCRYFFMCLRTGHPRRAGCSNGKVFDRATGICKAAKDVPECADYYGKAAASTISSSTVDEARLRKVEANLKKQFEERRQLIQLRVKRWLKNE